MIPEAMTWPEAAVAIALILAVAAVVSVIVWQVFETGRSDVHKAHTDARVAGVFVGPRLELRRQFGV